MPSATQWLGLEADPVSAREKVVSAVGGVLALAGVLLLTEHALGLAQGSAVVASMGASAVLLFGVPHGQLSQPWAVFGGHLVSALIGVTVARTLGHGVLAAAVAVGAAIGAMHLLSCVHPPGGATALTAVIGAATHDLGYRFVVTPVMLNVILMLVIAVVYNAAFPWRRYPRPPRPAAAPGRPTHDEVVSALRSLDSLIDVDEADLVRLVELLAPGPSAGPASPREPRGLSRSPRTHLRRFRPHRDSVRR